MNIKRQDPIADHQATLRVLEQERSANVRDCFVATAVAIACGLLAFFLPSVPTAFLLVASVLILSFYIHGTLAGHRRLMDLRRRTVGREEPGAPVP